MIEIDFLPARYREEHAQRKRQFWRLVVVGMYAVLLCLAAYTQRVQRQRVEGELKAADRQQAAVMTQIEQLMALEKKLERAQAQAELYTFLRHPWPRTQILSSVLASLPQSIALDELRVQRVQSGEPQAAMLRDRQRAAAANPDEAKPDTRPLARRDFDALQEAQASAQVVVTLAGTTSDETSLHVYLGQLADEPLFTKVELVSIARVEGRQGASRFSAKAIVRPGYARAEQTAAAARSARVSDPAEVQTAGLPGNGETSRRSGGSVGDRPQRVEQTAAAETKGSRS